MKFSKEDLTIYMELLKEAEELEPVFKEAVSVTGRFLGELKPLFESFRKFHIEQRVASIRQFQAEGFSKEEAMMLTMDLSLAVQNFNKIIKNSK